MKRVSTRLRSHADVCFIQSVNIKAFQPSSHSFLTALLLIKTEKEIICFDLKNPKNIQMKSVVHSCSCEHSCSTYLIVKVVFSIRS